MLKGQLDQILVVKQVITGGCDAQKHLPIVLYSSLKMLLIDTGSLHVAFHLRPFTAFMSQERRCSNHLPPQVIDQKPCKKLEPTLTGINKTTLLDPTLMGGKSFWAGVRCKCGLFQYVKSTLKPCTLPGGLWDRGGKTARRDHSLMSSLHFICLISTKDKSW